MTYGCQTWSLTEALVKKLETSQQAMEKKMLNVKLKDRIRNTIIRQRTTVTNIVQYVTNTKWKWAGHIAQMKGNGWHRVADKGCKISLKTKMSLARWHCGATGSGMDKDSEGQRKMEGSGGGLLPAVEGQKPRTEQNRIVIQFDKYTVKSFWKSYLLVVVRKGYSLLDSQSIVLVVQSTGKSWK